MRHVIETGSIVDIGVEVPRPGNVVVVVDDAGRRREGQVVARSELADLIVLEPAVRVAEVTAPPADHPLA